MKPTYFWRLLAFMIVAGLWLSSSTPYHKQSITGVIDQTVWSGWLADLLSGVQFNYDQQEVSIQHLGYAKFIEFFVRKAVHVMTFGLLGISLYLSYFVRRKRLAFALLASFFLAVVDECHQYFTPDRTAYIGDVVLDFMGSSLFLWVFTRMKAIKK